MHQLSSQPAGSNIPDSYGSNLFVGDADFLSLLQLYLDPALLMRVKPEFEYLGRLAGGPLEDLAMTADKNAPVLHLRARNGADQEWIEKHPSYLELERYAYGEFGLAAMSHRGGVFGSNDKLPPLVKYGLVYLFVQAEFGLCCPLSMTDSLTRTLTKFGSQDLIDRYFDELTSQDMDEAAQGAMFITEQIAGSDVGVIETEARFEDGEWRLFGDKWFCSNPDAELAMVLARPEGGQAGTKGLNLFLLPRNLPDGRRNDYQITRLKEKLGTRSMASGEISLNGAVAYMVGDPGQGFKQMTDMINMSRLSNGVRSAGLMRKSFSEALYNCENRQAFGKALIDLPLQLRQMIKMLVPTEQGRSIVLHTAKVLEKADQGEGSYPKLLRILTPLIKFKTCRDARKVASDAMEVRGGCGYIEEWSDPRIVRDAQLGSVWEGTSNIVALDVARATRREDALTPLVDYLNGLLDQVELDADCKAPFAESLQNGAEMMQKVANDRALEGYVRQAASALYHATTAIIMLWEASQLNAGKLDGSEGERWNRALLAKLVLDHRLTSADPFSLPEADPNWIKDLVTNQPISKKRFVEVMRYG